MSQISEYLTKCREAIHIAINDQDISSTLATYGYNQDKLFEGRDLYETAKTADDAQNNLRAKKTKAFTDYDQLYKQVQKTHTKHLNLARVAFEDHADASSELFLTGKREKPFSAWEKQCGTFYRVLTENTSFQAIINTYLPQAEITATNADFLHVLELHESYKIARSEAQDATDIRKKALQSLKKWMKAFYNVAKVAFADSPQKLEKIGIIH